MIEKVKKRTGRIENFNRNKVLSSIHKSMQQAGIKNLNLEEKITNDVINKLKRKRVVSVEDIRKAVCHVLKKNKRHRVCDFYSLVWLHAKPVKIIYVIKRDGRKEKFSPEKLFKSVQKSFDRAYVKDGKTLGSVVKEALETLNKRYKDKYVASDEIKDIVEYVLLKRKLPEVAKQYVIYRYM